MEWGHLLTHSSLTHPEVSLTVTPGYFYLLVCSFLIILGNLLRGIMFVRCTQFLPCSCILSKTGVIFSCFAISLCFIAHKHFVFKPQAMYSPGRTRRRWGHNKNKNKHSEAELTKHDFQFHTFLILQNHHCCLYFYSYLISVKKFPRQ